MIRAGVPFNGKKQFTTKPDKKETTKTGTENPPLTKPIRMKDIGESPTWEANRPMKGRKIRYNTKETKPLNITKQQLRIGNWNVQVLNAPGKIDFLADECEQYQLDIVALTELHWPGQGRTSHNKWEIINSGPNTSRRNKTAGIMLSQTAAKSLLSYECVSDRLIVARFNCKHTKLSIVVCYAPTNCETRPDDVANKNAFYEQLDDVVSNIPKHDMQIIIGDMNAEVGNDTSTWKPALGMHAE